MMGIIEKIKQIFRIKSKPPYYPGIGYMYRIPHFDKNGNDLALITFREWLEEHVKTGEHFSVYMICEGDEGK